MEYITTMEELRENILNTSPLKLNIRLVEKLLDAVIYLELGHATWRVKQLDDKLLLQVHRGDDVIYEENFRYATMVNLNQIK